MFKKFLSDTKLTKQSEWLLAVGFLTRFAKKRFDLFQEYKKRSITANGVMEALEMHLAGQLENIPLCLKKKNGEEKMKPFLKSRLLLGEVADLRLLFTELFEFCLFFLLLQIRKKCMEHWFFIWIMKSSRMQRKIYYRD